MDIGRIAQRFPLVARPRPACPPLTERIREISTLAEAAHHDGGLSSAATALNRAALIASDCGLPDLARNLCWRHVDIYLSAKPLSGTEARFALEPLVNLARLHIRAGDGDGAYQLLSALYDAVRRQAETTIDGRALLFQDLTEAPKDRRSVCQWLWTVLIGDGTRALVSAQRWDRAREHIALHKGVGHRLLDGRQVEIVSRCLNGDLARARHVLDDSTLSEAWETPVASCLALLCRAVEAAPTQRVTTKATADYLALEATPELAVFRARLGLTVLALSPHRRPEVARRLVHDATLCPDGYVAREILGNTACAWEMTSQERGELIDAVTSGGLDQGSMPSCLEEALLDGVETSASAVAAHLMAARTRPPRPPTCQRDTL
ncbi:hypothetical protein [Streptomyces smyrnaeus]|uniref:hypothetical protein n=1 Tax=Streptomyces smyrnaeus TaxID=1387713 RepID=UPI0033FB8C79